MSIQTFPTGGSGQKQAQGYTHAIFFFSFPVLLHCLFGILKSGLFLWVLPNFSQLPALFPQGAWKMVLPKSGRTGKLRGIAVLPWRRQPGVGLKASVLQAPDRTNPWLGMAVKCPSEDTCVKGLVLAY